MKNSKLTAEQKAWERQYQRCQRVIQSASRQQQLMKPVNGYYSQQQQDAYSKYQELINRAVAQMAELIEKRNASLA